MSVRDVSPKDLEPLLAAVRGVRHQQYLLGEVKRHLLREEWTGGGLDSPGTGCSSPPEWLKRALHADTRLEDLEWILSELVAGRVGTQDVEFLLNLVETARDNK